MSVVPLRLLPNVDGEPSAAEDPARLVEGLRNGEAWAERTLLERHTPSVRRVLVRILGATRDVDDLTQEVFLRALDRLDDVNDPSGLAPWLLRFAVNVAREALRSRARRRWLLFLPPEELPESPDEVDGGRAAEAARAVRATYEVLDGLSVDARLAFTLRHIDEMELADVARACGVSLATIKRRLVAAEATFAARARKVPALRGWLEEGERWGERAGERAGERP
jgi:RNA polymerase sigma-70 factor (ECF subfamily)